MSAREERTTVQSRTRLILATAGGLWHVEELPLNSRVIFGVSSSVTLTLPSRPFMLQGSHTFANMYEVWTEDRPRPIASYYPTTLQMLVVLNNRSNLHTEKRRACADQNTYPSGPATT